MAGLWRHKTLPINFNLALDEFRVKYVGREHIKHLKNALESVHKMATYWERKLYIGITLKWNYIKCMVELLIPGCVESPMHEFQHPKPPWSKDSPYSWTASTYGANSQLAPLLDTTPTLSPENAPGCKDWLKNSYTIVEPLVRPWQYPSTNCLHMKPWAPRHSPNTSHVS